MTELISSASLMMTVVAILYGVWHNDIVSLLSTKPSKFKADNKAILRTAKNVFFGKALPLVLLASCVTLIFCPNAIQIFIHSLHSVQLHGLPSIHSYSAVNTAYCFVVFLCFMLTVYAIILAARVAKFWFNVAR